MEIAKHVSGNTFLLRHASSPRLQLSLLIDRLGGVRSVSTFNVRRAWARPLVWFHDITLSESEIAPAAHLTNAELIAHLKGLGRKWDPHFAKALQLFKFLHRQPPGDLFGEAAFRAFWLQNCPLLNAGDWEDQFPVRTG